MASLRTSAAITERHGNIVPSYVLDQRRQARAERRKRLASTIIASAISEGAA